MNGNDIAPDQTEAMLIASQQAVSSNVPQQEQTQPPDSLLFFIPISFVLLWSIATAVFLGLPKLVYSGNRKVKVAQKIPCYQCQFFTNNPYLRCAVRPETVLTESALDCSDFQARLQPENKVGSSQTRR
ncbi:hypothetical protein NDI45_22720 [Leptolyngbya sp. GB1-A1]|jgi:hypothetical protein|uniref:hypothetical protein n=1 Tax=Leptolyngbya sp. GB1-A1 TaxID=2933908 RepID=UPI0032970290